MNPWIGWALALAALVIGWRSYGWQGLLLAFSMIVFWLILQFNKAVRVMRQAGSAPIGYIDSAVMLNARLHRGMRMMQLVLLTRSLGEKLGDAPERYRWSDPGGSQVTVEVRGGKVQAWELSRPGAQDPASM
ncbi:hypothetical protein [Eleftheria terrae]|uniref:hypothetical protein n=1 Tax=Eleftheria terrae TaxID=1597781 RepID=UPI00263BDB8B|nr:hypothetical protein [Eleftheria terrae]WKB51376.1 hypothetical protein N7L95_16380 [Eleftheria terrae]